jgi:hypothetical protein
MDENNVSTVKHKKLNERPANLPEEAENDKHLLQ